MTEDANRHGQEPRARLRAIHPLGVRFALELGERPAVVGRLTGEDDTPSLRHGTVSRRHFELHWNDSHECHVGHDLGSHNGSRVDGQTTGPMGSELRDGSVLQLGDVSLVYEVLTTDAPVILPSLAVRSPPADAGLELPTRPRGPASTTAEARAGGWMPNHPLPGDAPSSEALRYAVQRVATDPTPILLHGERGVGKRCVARELHRLSKRSGTLVEVPCSSLDPARIDALLTSADEGTLFLDGVDGMPATTWTTLHRALIERGLLPESSPCAVRLVASATEGASLDPELRSTLAGFELRVPPLRERRGDLLVWLEQLYTQWLEQRPDEPVETLTLSPEAVERVLLHPWHDNLRELDRLVHELASDPDLPRPIPLPRLPAWLLRGSAATTMPIAGPPTVG